MNISPRSTFAKLRTSLSKASSSFIVDNTTYLWVKYFQIFLKGSIHGSGNIPKTGCILAMNHVSYLDWILCYSLFRRKYHKKIVFIGKAKLLNSFLWKSYLIGTGAIIIDYSSRESFKNLLSAVKSHLDNGALIGIFPEGTRSPTGKLQKAQEGIGHILIQMNAPVIPIGLIGFYEAWPRHKKFPGISKCTIQIGEPIYFNPSEFDRKIAKSSITNTVMEAIAKLTCETYPYSKNFIESFCNSSPDQISFFNKKEQSDVEKKDLILFDLDGTLIEGQTQKIFLDILRDEKIVTLYDFTLLTLWFIAYKLRIITKTKKARKFAFRKLANRQVIEIEKIIETHFSKFRNKIFHNSLEIINKFKSQNDKIIVISASIEPIVKMICKELSLDEYICTKLDVYDGKFSGNFVGIPMYGDEKINQIKNYLTHQGKKFNKIYYYNDHISDIGLMEFVDVPVCVNPDPKLRKIAIEKKWEILNWKN
jgi:1-acyl-sn-glycerol-3-phosphate acyltransferase